jgi:hypothetical protein
MRKTHAVPLVIRIAERRQLPNRTLATSRIDDTVLEDLFPHAVGAIPLTGASVSGFARGHTRGTRVPRETTDDE